MFRALPRTGWLYSGWWKPPRTSLLPSTEHQWKWWSEMPPSVRCCHRLFAAAIGQKIQKYPLPSWAVLWSTQDSKKPTRDSRSDYKNRHPKTPVCSVTAGQKGSQVQWSNFGSWRCSKAALIFPFQLDLTLVSLLFPIYSQEQVLTPNWSVTAASLVAVVKLAIILILNKQLSFRLSK